VLIAHFPTEMAFSFDPPTGGWCQFYWDSLRIEDCEDQVNRIDTGNQVIWFVLAAWDEDKEWCGTEFGFGEYDSDTFVITDFSPCWPENGLEIPTASWPGPGEGTAIVTTGAPWEGNFVPVYRFTGLAYEEGLIPLAADPATGFAGTSNCANPPESWAADSLGGMGLFQNGVYACPEGWIFAAQNMGERGTEPQGVCCIGEACQVTTPSNCHTLGGDFYAGYETCDPNPCPGLLQHIFCELTPDSTIQVSIDRGCDEIELADGTYLGDGNRDINFWGRDIVVYSASGDSTACVIDCEGSENDPHRGFLFRTYEGPQAKVRGVTITNGYSGTPWT
jgi:hypothetical protein